MSSKPQPRTSSRPIAGSIPFASYTRIVRMLLPLTGKASFYDEDGEAPYQRWARKHELRMHVEVLLHRCVTDPGETPVDYSASDEGQPTYVFAFRHQDSTLVARWRSCFAICPNAS
jgi:hypothetical protein